LGFQSERKGLVTTAGTNHYPREFHLWDLPQKQIFGRLDDDYRRVLISSLVERLGIVTLSELLNVDPVTVREWTVDSSDQLAGQRSGYLRLDVLFRVAHIAGNGFSANEIEGHVTALKGYRRSLPAYDIRFPFVESSSMIRLLMHFIGDGSLYPTVGSTKPSAYTNKNAILRKGFISCLKEIFGDVSTCVRERTSDLDRAHVSVPKWISYVVAHFYPDALFGQLQARLPIAIFSLPRKLQTEAIRTLADDDGSVQELCIRFVSGSRTLLEDTRRLMLQIVQEDPELSRSEKDTLGNALSSVRQQRNWYRLDVGFRAFKWYRRTIGFSHPDKKRELDFRIRAAQRSRLLDTLTHDFLILSELLSGQRTAQDIAIANFIREEYVHAALRYHSARGRVVKCGKSLKRKKAAWRWALTDCGRKWVHTLSVANKRRSKDFMREALPHRDYMRYRWLKSVELTPE